MVNIDYLYQALEEEKIIYSSSSIVPQIFVLCFLCGRKQLFTQGYRDTLNSRAWRPYTEAEVEFKTIEGTIEVSSKKPFKRGHLQPLYRPLKRPKLRSDSSPRRSVCSKKQHKNLSFCTWSFTNTALVSYIVKLQ